MSARFADRSVLYRETLERLMNEGVLTRDMDILVLCAGGFDKEMLERLGFQNVTVSNLSKNLQPDEFKPFAAVSLDVEEIDLPDGAFDWCVVHAGLHHCAVPQKAILEMYRVARVGLVACEPICSFATRISMRLGLSQSYEIGSVVNKLELGGGGLRFGGIPNWIYRFSSWEVKQTIRTAHPEARHRYIILKRLVVPWHRFRGKWTPKALAVKIMSPFLRLVQRVPLFANNIAFAVLKPTLPDDLQPWLREQDGEIVVDSNWFNENWTNS